MCGCCCHFLPDFINGLKSSLMQWKCSVLVVNFNQQERDDVFLLEWCIGVCVNAYLCGSFSAFMSGKKHVCVLPQQRELIQVQKQLGLWKWNRKVEHIESFAVSSDCKSEWDTFISILNGALGAEQDLGRMSQPCTCTEKNQYQLTYWKLGWSWDLCEQYLEALW